MFVAQPSPPILTKRRLTDIHPLQEIIMHYIDNWVRTQKTTVPKKNIIDKLTAEGIKDFTIVNALNMLLKKGYIRKAYTSKTSYVQIRSI